MNALLHRLRAHRGGSAVVEFAMLAPLLVLLAVGIYDYGMALSQRTQVESAARAGAAYVTAYGWDAEGISRAVTGATGNAAISAVPAPSRFCGCGDAATGVVATTCDSPCPGGDVARAYVSVGASAIYSVALPLPLGATSFTLRATSVARVQ